MMPLPLLHILSQMVHYAARIIRATLKIQAPDLNLMKTHRETVNPHTCAVSKSVKAGSSF